MCEYCEKIFTANANYNVITGRIEKIKTTKPLQCWAGDIRNDGLKTMWIQVTEIVGEKYMCELFARPFFSNPRLREEGTIKVKINYCPMCGRKLEDK